MVRDGGVPRGPGGPPHWVRLGSLRERHLTARFRTLARAGETAKKLGAGVTVPGFPWFPLSLVSHLQLPIYCVVAPRAPPLGAGATIRTTGLGAEETLLVSAVTVMLWLPVSGLVLIG